MNCDPQIKALSRKLLLARHLVLAAREVTNRRNGGDDAEKEARNRTRYVSPLRRKKKMLRMFSLQLSSVTPAWDQVQSQSGKPAGSLGEPIPWLGS